VCEREREREQTEKTEIAFTIQRRKGIKREEEREREGHTRYKREERKIIGESGCDASRISESRCDAVRIGENGCCENRRKEKSFA